MTDQTRTEALRKCRLFVEHCIQTGNTFAVGEALLKEIDAALSHSQAQGVTITDEMVERALNAFDPAHKWRTEMEIRYENHRSRMRAALEAASLPKDSAQGEVPFEPTEAMWGGLARDMIMWTRFTSHTGADLHKHLASLGRTIPDWLIKEIPNADCVPSKGTVAVCIWKAMYLAVTTTDKG